MRMYINTCDATMFFLPLFNYFYTKYWPEMDTAILGYAHPTFALPTSQKYISMAPVQQGGVNNWSTYLRSYFESIEDEIIMWGIDDHLISDHVDTDIIENMTRRMQEDKTIGRVGLTYGISNRQHTIVDSTDRYDVIELTQCETPGSPYAFRIDCNFGLWRREYLLKYLMNGWTPWQFEVDGSKMARYDGWRILSTKRKYGVLKVEGKRGIEPGKVNLLGIKFEDILEILRLGLVKKEEIIGAPEWL